MYSNTPSVAVIPGRGWLRLWLSPLALLLSGSAWGAVQDIDISCTPAPGFITYAITPSTSVPPIGSPAPVNPEISVLGTSNNVFWDFISIGANCSATANPEVITCLGMNVTLPPGSTTTAVSPGQKVTISGTSQSTNGELSSSFTLIVQEDKPAPFLSCTREYRPRVTSSGGGWGDPHITTVDGVNYDFQSAGEFISLRGDGLEIQTRQTPVSKNGVSGTNPYTGLATCVAIYTAVAARVGTHRVSIQPNISGKPDPSGLQIRVNGTLRMLTVDGIGLGSDGKIVKAPEGDGIEIHYANGTKLVVTPKWWNSQQKWYLNVNVYDTTATEGIMGRIADGSWLPALADGTALGRKPDSLHDRYIQLYETFADSWRVTDATGPRPSLFDYAPGDSTATFTLDEWPRENPTTCLIAEEPVAEPIDESVAEEACSEVIDENNRANCIFDVRETGHLGFADAYVQTERLAPGATWTRLKVNRNASKLGDSVTFTATVKRTVSTGGGAPTGTVQFILNGNNVGSPVALDANGKAEWSTSSLQLGTHKVVAQYLPSPGFGERFRTSSSLEVSHTVSLTGPSKWGLSLHLGSTIPSGNFSNDYDPSYSATLDLEYEITPNYSVSGLLGYHDFQGARAGISDTYWVNLSGNLKYYPNAPAPWRPWVNAGAGLYWPESGSARGGVNLGAGIGYVINPQWRWELGVDYHNVFTSGSDTRFFTPRIGVIFNF